MEWPPRLRALLAAADVFNLNVLTLPNVACEIPDFAFRKRLQVPTHSQILWPHSNRRCFWFRGLPCAEPSCGGAEHSCEDLARVASRACLMLFDRSGP